MRRLSIVDLFFTNRKEYYKKMASLKIKCVEETKVR
jgi:hypothetical protein